MTLDPDCVSVRIDNSAASANSLRCKIMPAVKSGLNCGAGEQVMESVRGERVQWKPAAVLNQSHLLLTAILKQEEASVTFSEAESPETLRKSCNVSTFRKILCTILR